MLLMLVIRNTFLKINYQMVDKHFVHVNIIHVFNFSITCDMIPIQYLILSFKKSVISFYSCIRLVEEFWYPSDWDVLIASWSICFVD